MQPHRTSTGLRTDLRFHCLECGTGGVIPSPCNTRATSRSASGLSLSVHLWVAMPRGPGPQPSPLRSAPASGNSGLVLRPCAVAWARPSSLEDSYRPGRRSLSSSLGPSLLCLGLRAQASTWPFSCCHRGPGGASHSPAQMPFPNQPVGLIILSRETNEQSRRLICWGSPTGTGAPTAWPVFGYTCPPGRSKEPSV